MKISFSHTIDNEPVFSGTFNNKSFKVLFVRTDIDYGWHFLDYLPTFNEQDAGTDILDDIEYDDILEYLSNYSWQDFVTCSWNAKETA